MEKEISHIQFVKDYYKLNRNKYINPYSWGNYLPKSWFNDVFFNLNCEIILEILQRWRKNPPSQQVLENFKECLNYKIMAGNYFTRIISFQSQEKKEIIYHLIHFGLECDQNILQAIKEINKKIKKLEEDKIFLEKIKAGKVIVEYIEEAMDDEFEMKPLRTKIDLGNIKRLHNQNN